MTKANQTSAPQLRDFLAGRDLAVAMLEHGERLRSAKRDDGVFYGDLASVEAEYRGGHPQDIWVREYLQRVIDNPALMEGFCALLSDQLVHPGTHLGMLQGLTLKEMRPEWSSREAQP